MGSFGNFLTRWSRRPTTAGGIAAVFTVGLSFCIVAGRRDLLPGGDFRVPGDGGRVSAGGEIVPGDGGHEFPVAGQAVRAGRLADHASGQGSGNAWHGAAGNRQAPVGGGQGRMKQRA